VNARPLYLFATIESDAPNSWKQDDGSRHPENGKSHNKTAKQIERHSRNLASAKQPLFKTIIKQVLHRNPR
jgi:hypothetical protein